MSVYGKKINNEYLDTDMCFCAWLIGGSIGKARKRMVTEGVSNPVTGNPPSRMGIWFAARKSPMYAEFVKLREQSNSVGDRPTKEEFEKAIAYLKTSVEEYHKKYDTVTLTS